MLFLFSMKVSHIQNTYGSNATEPGSLFLDLSFPVNTLSRYLTSTSHCDCLYMCNLFCWMMLGSELQGKFWFLVQAQALIGCIWMVQDLESFNVLIPNSRCLSLVLLPTSLRFPFGTPMELMSAKRPVLYCELLITGSGCYTLTTQIIASLCHTTHQGGSEDVPWHRSIGDFTILKQKMLSSPANVSCWRLDRVFSVSISIYVMCGLAMWYLCLSKPKSEHVWLQFFKAV